ncbi:hypothetical protein [Deinococcus alpinitundrae]|uniref:hypothetical protein n=1 Tax=Deinococcus alpinitundrae TaxID=468913 RepID=UPI00137B0741|nr:hypothetical protein [Deinococcus alpinitundrae]
MKSWTPENTVQIYAQPTRSSHHVCFDCRKQFQKPAKALGQRTRNRKFRSAGVVLGDPTFPCPQCHQLMTPVGKNFRAPKQTDVEAWKLAEQLVRAGFAHNHTTGTKYPQRLKDVPGFLADHQRRSEGEQLLAQWREEN